MHGCHFRVIRLCVSAAIIFLQEPWRVMRGVCCKGVTKAGEEEEEEAAEAEEGLAR